MCIVLERDCEKARPGPRIKPGASFDPGWIAVSRLREARFGRRRQVGKRSCSKNKLERRTNRRKVIPLQRATCNYAIVTLSLPRRGRFQGLALDDALARRGAEPWCGLMIIDSRHGDVVEWVRFAGESELLDVAAIPLTRCPTVIAPDGSDMQDANTFEEDLPAPKTAVPVQEAAHG